jgi:hypothetical protein
LKEVKMSNQISPPQSQSQSNAIDFVLEKLSICVNGKDKIATGLTKQTTMSDIKYAMLSVTDPEFRPSELDNYAVFEKWQGNERMLDDRTKIYKLVRLWKSLPGNQLQNVKFVIKTKKRGMQQPELKTHIIQYKSNCQMVPSQGKRPAEISKKYEFCTLSPQSEPKALNLERAKRNNQNQKSSYLKKQLLIANQPIDCERQINEYGTLTSMSSRDSSVSCSPRHHEPDSGKLRQGTTMDRYASIKKTNRSRKSTVQKVEEPRVGQHSVHRSNLDLKESFINLVNMQSELISKQHDQLKQEQDGTGDSKSSHLSANDTEIKECLSLYNSYFNTQVELNEKMQEIQLLKRELNDLKSLKKKAAHRLEFESSEEGLIHKASNKLTSTIAMYNLQNNRMGQLSKDLTRLDDIIRLKQRYVASLEQELNILDELSAKESTAFARQNQPSHLLDGNNNEMDERIIEQRKAVTKLNTSSDNDSDTGISSVNSEDFGNVVSSKQNQIIQPLETLV